ncbi:MAG: iron-sulfur cluster repair di-iron protein [Bacteroidetes bacterium]|nr:MAG: iron-sulfur cluster repair di-iron protein [Bacteroidota bacterium]TAG89388.1 MAG: iron-sulfur cluster repair di-iron protein [Bacteroidota bacterium]
MEKIKDLVSENFIWANVLHHIGYKFYDCLEYDIEQICQELHINFGYLSNKLEEISKRLTPPKKIAEYNLDVLVQYLRSSHHWFIKYQFPYISNLIEALPTQNDENISLIRDLQMLFPLLREDFIHHIHEEEDTLFQHILLLDEGQKNPTKLNKIYKKIEHKSIQFFALEHNTHDDEMKGIRELTKNYQIPAQCSILMKVIILELQELEKDLKIHAKIEDEILFVKALQTEKKLKSQVAELVKWN